jgi:AcrR family transcriptional regulator
MPETNHGRLRRMESGTTTRDPGLPRSVEKLSQRERLLWSMVRATAEKGYDDVTVHDVVARAGLSRITFSEEFESKDECLFAAYDRVIDELVVYVADAFSSERDWPVRVRDGLDALLRALAAEPDVAQMAAVEFPSAGPQAHQRYRDALERFLPFLQEGREFSGRPGELPPAVELMAVGGAEVIIFDEVVGGRVSSLPAMLPEIVFAVLVPFIGPEDAAAAMHAAVEQAG